MGFLDSIREKLLGNKDDYYQDEYQDAEYADDDASTAQRRRQPLRSGMLGNPSRPEAESVAVYTRAGQRVNSATSSTLGDAGASPVSRNYAMASAGSTVAAASPRSIDTSLRPIPRKTFGQLPPYVLHPSSYEDVQSVMRRVRTGQSVVLSFDGTNIETAKRILDFCFGLACGIEGRVDELGDRTFVVLPPHVELDETALQKLVADGIIKR